MTSSCKKEPSRDEIMPVNTEVDGQMVDLLNENINSLRELAICYGKEDKVIYSDNYGLSDDAYRFYFESGSQLVFPKLSNYKNLPCPSVSMIFVDSVFFWTLNDHILRDEQGIPISVDSTRIAPKLYFESGCWYYTINGTEYKYCEAQESFRPICFENPKNCGFVVFVLPLGCKIVVPESDCVSKLRVFMPNMAYYKDVFLDAGIGLTSRRQLYATLFLGLSLECMSFSSDDYTDLQNQLIEGDSLDVNGRLLYPDGQPRYKLLFVNGGRATMHGQSLTEGSHSNMRLFREAGGSYVGTCAGAFFASNGYNRPEINPDYLHIWPEFVHNTHLSQSHTGFVITPNSPLLDYFDFGGDFYLDSVRHNGGCYPDVLPLGSEVLALYDYPAIESMHLQPSAWAYKENSTAGRIVQIGSHPEEVSDGEQRDFTAASILYAIEGRGVSIVKGSLQNGIWRDMDKTTSENDPDYTVIGDLQCHHFLTYIPDDAVEVEFNLNCDADVDMSLMISKDVYAYEEYAQYVSESTGANHRFLFSRLSKGLWFVTVKCNTTVDVTQTEWGQEYGGRTDVLNGVPYSVRVKWSTPLKLAEQLKPPFYK